MMTSSSSSNINSLTYLRLFSPQVSPMKKNVTCYIMRKYYHKPSQLKTKQNISNKKAAVLIL